MMKPAAFGYNAETQASNSFQKRVSLHTEGIHRKALHEFESLLSLLKANAIPVHVFNDTVLPVKPDAVFLNNWFSTHHDGSVVLYPMQAMTRRAERRADILERLKAKYRVNRLIDLSHLEGKGKFLEGTGSLVFDHSHAVVYACASPRTNEELAQLVANELGYRCLIFSATDESGVPVYHTNVVMNISAEMCVICADAITENKSEVIGELQKQNRTLVEISAAQMADFAGNMLVVKNTLGKSYAIMSTRAYNSLAPQQREAIASCTTILHSDLSTIENIGGGSARCMLAENFLTPAPSKPQ